MSDIVERLRERASSLRGLGAIAHPDADTDDAAAAEITTLRAENERLREALEGVTEIAESYLNMMPDRHGIHGPKIEAARAALNAPTAVADVR